MFNLRCIILPCGAKSILQTCGTTAAIPTQYRQLNSTTLLNLRVSLCAGILDTFGSQRLQLGGPVHMETLTLLHAFAGLSGAQKVSEVSNRRRHAGFKMDEESESRCLNV
jgi:hypothetical protein